MSAARLLAIYPDQPYRVGLEIALQHAIGRSAESPHGGTQPFKHTCVMQTKIASVTKITAPDHIADFTISVRFRGANVLSSAYDKWPDFRCPVVKSFRLGLGGGRCF